MIQRRWRYSNKGHELTTKLITLGPPVTGPRGTLPVFDTLLYPAVAVTGPRARHPRTAAVGACTRQGLAPRPPDTPPDQHVRAVVAHRAPPCAAAAVDLVTASPLAPRRQQHPCTSAARPLAAVYSLLGPGHGQTSVARRRH